MSIQRILPYTKQLVLLALYDVLDQEKSEYSRNKSGDILAGVNVYGNYSEFSFTVSEDTLATNFAVEVVSPGIGLSEQGKQRAENYLADRVEQLLENELKIKNLIMKGIKEA